MRRNCSTSLYNQTLIQSQPQYLLLSGLTVVSCRTHEALHVGVCACVCQIQSTQLYVSVHLRSKRSGEHWYTVFCGYVLASSVFMSHANSSTAFSTLLLLLSGFSRALLKAHKSNFYSLCSETYTIIPPLLSTLCTMVLSYPWIFFTVSVTVAINSLKILLYSNKKLRYFERDHKHITFMTVYCYNFSILLLLLLSY